MEDRSLRWRPSFIGFPANCTGRNFVEVACKELFEAKNRQMIENEQMVKIQSGENTLNIDLRNPERGPGARIALELTAASALDLARAILAALADVPADLLAEELPADRLAGLTGRASSDSFLHRCAIVNRLRT